MCVTASVALQGAGGRSHAHRNRTSKVFPSEYLVAQKSTQSIFGTGLKSHLPILPNQPEATGQQDSAPVGRLAGEGAPALEVALYSHPPLIAPSAPDTHAARSLARGVTKLGHGVSARSTGACRGTGSSTNSREKRARERRVRDQAHAPE